MKNLLLLMITFCSMPAFAQQGDIESVRDPQAREKIRAAHAAYVTERLELTPAEAEKFWPVYREYAERRRGLRQQMRTARQRELDETALLHLDLKIKQDELDLEKTYTEKLQNIISSQKLLKLRDAEADFRKLLLRQIQQRRRQRR
jgi:hypothetical protein